MTAIRVGIIDHLLCARLYMRHFVYFFYSLKQLVKLVLPSPFYR